MRVPLEAVVCECVVCTEQRKRDLLNVRIAPKPRPEPKTYRLHCILFSLFAFGHNLFSRCFFWNLKQVIILCESIVSNAIGRSPADYVFRRCIRRVDSKCGKIHDRIYHLLFTWSVSNALNSQTMLPTRDTALRWKRSSAGRTWYGISIFTKYDRIRFYGRCIFE